MQRWPSFSTVNPHATGDVAAEIICFSCYSPQPFREFYERIFTAVFCLAHYYRNAWYSCVSGSSPVTLEHWVSVLSISETVKWHWANSDGPNLIEEWGLGESWEAHALKAWRWLRACEFQGGAREHFSACLLSELPFSSYLADQFLSPLRGVQASANQSFPVCGRYKYYLPAPWVQEQAPLCQWVSHPFFSSYLSAYVFFFYILLKNNY